MDEVSCRMRHGAQCCARVLWAKIRYKCFQRGRTDLLDVIEHPHCRDMQGQKATHIHRCADDDGVTRCGIDGDL